MSVPSRRLRLVVEYDGTDFHGWQRQDNGSSIQAALEVAVDRLTHEGNEVRGAGRTVMHAATGIAGRCAESDSATIGGFYGVPAGRRLHRVCARRSGN